MIVYVLGGGRMTLLQDDVSLWQFPGPLIRDTHDSDVSDGRVLQNETLQLRRGHLFIMTSSNGSTFCVTDPLCGEFTGYRWIPLTKASDAELWCFFDLRLDKRSSKQSWGWWFGTPSHSLWRHFNVERKMWLTLVRRIYFRKHKMSHVIGTILCGRQGQLILPDMHCRRISSFSIEIGVQE